MEIFRCGKIWSRLSYFSNDLKNINCNVKPFYSNVTFLYPGDCQKTVRNLWFSEVIRGYRNVTLNCFCSFKHFWISDSTFCHTVFHNYKKLGLYKQVWINLVFIKKLLLTWCFFGWFSFKRKKSKSLKCVRCGISFKN